MGFKDGIGKDRADALLIKTPLTMIEKDTGKIIDKIYFFILVTGLTTLPFYIRP